MTLEEQTAFLSKEHAEANRYMDNAKETLRKAEKRDDGQYKDEKYVRSACGIAYLGVLRALDAWLVLKGVQLPNKKKQKTIEFYQSNVTQLDKKLVAHVNSAYNVLHLEGYYRGETSVKIIGGGFDEAYYIIDKIRPDNPVEVAETRGEKTKRMLNSILISAAVMFMRKPY